MNTRAKIAFAAISILWGIPYLLIKIAVDAGISPAFLAWGRVVLGAVILLAISDRKEWMEIVRERWKWIALFALVEIVIPFPLMAAGEQHVDSSVAAILIASAPLFVALLALRFDHTERVGGWRLAGLLIGLAGVVMFVGIDFAGRRDELLGALAILVCAFFYAVGADGPQEETGRSRSAIVNGDQFGIRCGDADAAGCARPAACGALG